MYRTRWPHTCRRCRGAIAAGEAAIHRANFTETADSPWFYHADCLIDVDPAAANYGLHNAIAWQFLSDDATEPRARNVADTDVGCPDLAALSALASQRFDQWYELVKLCDAQRKRKESVPVSRFSLREMSRDRQGRPRVSLLCVLVGLDSFGAAGVVNERLFTDYTLVSSLREYVLSEMTKLVALELPWEPIVGSLCIVSTRAKPTRRVLDRLLRLKAMGLPEPVLLLLGPADAQRDRCERALRSLLDEAGFVGDEAVSLCAETLDEASATMLGALLDEAISLDGVDEASEGHERTIAMLEEACREGRAQSYVSALVVARKRAATLDAAMAARATTCALQCLAHEPAQRAAVELLSVLPPMGDPTPLRALWIKELGRTREVSTLALAIEAELARRKDRAMWWALFTLIRATKTRSPRSSAWLSRLRACREAALAAELNTWAATILDARAIEARAVAEGIAYAASAEQQADVERGSGRRSASTDDAVLSPMAEHLRAILAAMEGPSVDELRPWLALARDCEGIAEFWERAQLCEGAGALASERWFFAEPLQCTRCGARDVGAVTPRGEEPWSRSQRCPSCALPWRARAHRATIPADWAAAVMVASRAARIESAERLARQVNESLAVFGEPPSSGFEWLIVDPITRESVYDVRGGGPSARGTRSVLPLAVDRGRALSRLNPVVLCDEVARVQDVASVAVEVARDLVALDGWARLQPGSKAHVAFAALDALYSEGAIYQGVFEGRLRLRLLWWCTPTLEGLLPRGR
jgi:hypothetical protein